MRKVPESKFPKSLFHATLLENLAKQPRPVLCTGSNCWQENDNAVPKIIPNSRAGSLPSNKQTSRAMPDLNLLDVVDASSREP